MLDQKVIEQKTTARKTLEVTRKARSFIKRVSQEAHEAKALGIPITYQFMVSNTDEICRALGVVPVFTENYAGLCAAKQDAPRFLDRAQDEGYSRTLCGYCALNLGFDAIRAELGAMPPNAADGGMEAPDVLLGMGGDHCDPRYLTYLAVRRYAKVPYYIQGFLWPPQDANLREVLGYYVRYRVEELRDFIAFIEKVVGKKMDYDKLAEIVDLAERTERTWWETYQLRKAVPCPMPTGDALSCLVPGRYFLGTREALDFYQELYAEVKQRVDTQQGVIPDEKYRLLYAGIPAWYALGLFNYYESKGAVCVVEDSYRAPDPIDLPPVMADPVERLAWRGLHTHLHWIQRAQQRTGSALAERLLNFIEQYAVDGVVFSRGLSCRTMHSGNLHVMDRLRKWTDVPMIVIEGDLIDKSAYNEDKTKERIDAFIDTVAANKATHR